MFLKPEGKSTTTYFIIKLILALNIKRKAPIIYHAGRNLLLKFVVRIAIVLYTEVYDETVYGIHE